MTRSLLLEAETTLSFLMDALKSPPVRTPLLEVSLDARRISLVGRRCAPTKEAPWKLCCCKKGLSMEKRPSVGQRLWGSGVPRFQNSGACTIEAATFSGVCIGASHLRHTYPYILSYIHSISRHQLHTFELFVSTSRDPVAAPQSAHSSAQPDSHAAGGSSDRPTVAAH